MPQHLSRSLCVLAFGGWACGSTQTATVVSPVANAVAEVDVATLRAAQAAGVVALVDVRSKPEFADGHLPGAVNIPVDELSQRLSELTAHQSEDLYLICRSGARSARAHGLLLDAGYVKPINVVGGMRAWQAAGFPLE